MQLPLENMAAIGAAGLIATAAWQDFFTWKIRNWIVLALLGVYVCLALTRLLEPPGLPDARTLLMTDVAAGLLLLVIGIILWMLSLFGAGDAKLLLPIGLFVGLHHLFAFGIALAIGGMVAAFLLRLPVPLQFQTWPLGFRIEEIRKTGKVPYGVVVAAAALVAMYLRHFAT